MKITTLISLVCSLVSGATLCAESMGADFSSDADAHGGRIKVATEVRSQPLAESVQNAGFQKSGTNKGDTLIAFSLFASAFGIVLLNALLRAPEGYEDGDGFHLSRRRAQTNPVRHIRRSLARI
jgi:hypothetical protein